MYKLILLVLFVSPSFAGPFSAGGGTGATAAIQSSLDGVIISTGVIQGILNNVIASTGAIGAVILSTGAIQADVDTRVLRAGDTMTGQLTLSGSSLTVTGDGLTVSSNVAMAGVIYTNLGNVGIGASPSANKLQITNIATGNGLAISAGSVNGTYYPLRALNTGGTKGIWVRDNGHLGINDSSADGELDIISDKPESGYIVSVSSQSDVTGGIFSILGNGKVGIGVASPSYDFQVNGAIYSSNYVWANAGLRAPFWLGDSFYFRNSANTIRWMTLETGGEIGIGTSVPNTKLHMSSGTFTVDGDVLQSISVNGVVNIGGFTTAQIDAKAGIAGGLISCSNCAVPYTVCVGSGTANGAWTKLNSADHCQ